MTRLLKVTDRRTYGIIVVKREVRDRLGDLGIGERIISTYLLKQSSSKIQTGFTCLIIRTIVFVNIVIAFLGSIQKTKLSLCLIKAAP